MSIASSLVLVATKLNMVVKLFPSVVTAITTVEALFGAEQGKGMTKLELVKYMIKVAFDAVDADDTDFEAAWPFLEGMISGIVKVFNNTGWLKF